MLHVPLERLHAVVTDDDLLFTEEEFDHVRLCADCFDKWKAFYLQTHPSMGEHEWLNWIHSCCKKLGDSVTMPIGGTSHSS